MEVPRPAGSLQAPSLHYWLRQERRRTRRLINALRDEPACRDAAAFEVVESMLIELGYPPERLRP